MQTGNHRRDARGWGGLTAGALVAIGVAGGCAGAPPRPVPQADHIFTISFARDSDKAPLCPRMVAIGTANCPDKRPDCVRARRGEVVAFVADPTAPFEIFFDPFKKAPLRASDGRVALQIDPQAPYKTYAFNVASGTCPVLDPIIIVEW